jgi:hypothetical protein
VRAGLEKLDGIAYEIVGAPVADSLHSRFDQLVRFIA